MPDELTAAERLRHYAEDALIREIEDISEDAYAARWMIGIERDLWRIMQSGGGRYGMISISRPMIARVRQLSEDAGGWVVWDDATNGGVLVQMDEWKRRFAELEAQR